MEVTIDNISVDSNQFTIEAEGDDNICGTVLF